MWTPHATPACAASAPTSATPHRPRAASGRTPGRTTPRRSGRPPRAPSTHGRSARAGPDRRVHPLASEPRDRVRRETVLPVEQVVRHPEEGVEVHELLLDRRGLRAVQVVEAPVRGAVDLEPAEHRLLEQRGDALAHPARRGPRARPAGHRLGVGGQERVHELVHEGVRSGPEVDDDLARLRDPEPEIRAAGVADPRQARSSKSPPVSKTYTVTARDGSRENRPCSSAASASCTRSLAGASA